MASSEEFQAMVKVSSEIDESDIKITYATQCIKGQEYLCQKLKQEIQKREEQWSFINNDNRKLEAEIKNAENEIKCLTISHEAITSANTELRKELLLAKDSYVELADRVKNGEMKYDERWLKAKQRYESIPFVQEWMEATKRAETLQNALNVLDSEEEILDKDIVKKKKLIREHEKHQIIELAEFLVKRESLLKDIREKQSQVTEVSKEVESLKAKRGFKSSVLPLNQAMSELNVEPTDIEITASGKIVDDNWCNLSKNFYGDSLMLPKLTLPSAENDSLDVKLDIEKAYLQVAPPTRTVSITEMENPKHSKPDETHDDYISCYFSKPKHTNKETEYSSRRLINILEDVRLDANEAYNMVAKINPDKLLGVDVIRGESPENGKPDENVVSERQNIAKDKKDKGPIESDEIEEIDFTNRVSPNILLPPSPFVDLTEDKVQLRSLDESVVLRCKDQDQAPEEGLNLNRGKDTVEMRSLGKMVLLHFKDKENAPEEGLNLNRGKDSGNKKSVSFDIPTSASIQEISDDAIAEGDNDTNTTIASDTSETAPSVSDDHMLKKMLAKRNQLDLSPQFFYARNDGLKKKLDDCVVTSKFFETNSKSDENKTDEVNNMEVTTTEPVADKDQNKSDDVQEIPQENNIEMAEDDAVRGSAFVASNVVNEHQVKEKPVAGLLFAHGSDLPDCLNISMSTTGYDDADPDYLCLDNSLLLSPKGDNEIQPMSSAQSEIGSQEVPNFLAGFKKASISFFKQNTTAANSAPNAQRSEDNFSFNFGGSNGDEKKGKGGMFSFFR